MNNRGRSGRKNAFRCVLSIHALVSSAMCFKTLLFTSRGALSLPGLYGVELLVRASAHLLAMVGDVESTAIRCLVVRKGRGTVTVRKNGKGGRGGGRGDGVDVAVWNWWQSRQHVCWAGGGDWTEQTRSILKIPNR